MTEGSKIVFYIKEYEEPLILIKKGKFYWKGKEVKDVDKIYERFCRWFDLMEKNG